MARSSNPRIDVRAYLALGWGMRFCLILPLATLTACASFPQVDAVASKSVGARPELLTAQQLNDLLPQSSEDDAPDDDLQIRAVGLPNR